MSAEVPMMTVPVAEYLRMSTDQQQCSIANQQASIRTYAADHGMRVARSYRDDGRSGLSLSGRPGLRQLLSDIRSDRPMFEAVLVFDVSRWGRFQNADESAFYEYLCTAHGVPVIYVAEPFGDGCSPISTVMKGLKRSMAAEYSRELSAKVTAGQRRLTSMGYWMGGEPGYGLRRMLVGTDGRPKGVMQPGQRKSFPTERVILVPGPPKEVRAVRRIFEESAKGVPTNHITRSLNDREDGRRWTKTAVRQMLKNEKYMGANVYGRMTQALKRSLTRQPAETWTRANEAFEPLVSPALFNKALQARSRRSAPMTDSEALSALRRVLRKHGRLTCGLIAKAKGVPSPQLYIRRFGSLRQAYELIDYVPDRDISYGRLREKVKVWRESVTSFAREFMEDCGSVVSREGRVLVVDGAWTLSIYLLQSSKDHHRRQWRVPNVARPTDIVVFARMAADGKSPLDYLVVPSLATSTWPGVITQQPDVTSRFFLYPSLAVLGDLAAVSRG